MIFTKDKKLVDLIADHMDTAMQCIKTAGAAVASYVEGNTAEAAELALQADALELDTSFQMDKILGRLCQGGGLAPIRENHYLLVSNLNRLADAAARCCLFFVDRRPDIPSAIRPAFIKLAEISFGASGELHTAALHCLRGSWHPGKGCESARRFDGLRKELKKLRRDLWARISEIGEAPGQQTALDISLVQVAAVFEAMQSTAEIVTCINLRLGN